MKLVIQMISIAMVLSLAPSVHADDEGKGEKKEKCKKECVLDLRDRVGELEGLAGALSAETEALALATEDLGAEVSELESRVSALESAEVGHCRCFDVAQLNQYQWTEATGDGSLGFDANGNTISTLSFHLRADFSNDRASVSRNDTVSPQGELLTSNFSCAFSDTDSPVGVFPGLPDYDPNFPVEVNRGSLSEADYESCRTALNSVPIPEFSGGTPAPPIVIPAPTLPPLSQ